MDNGLILRAEGLSKSFGSVIFEDISFSLSAGEALGVLGPNGSGKTTLLNIIAGLTPPDSGTLYKSGVKMGYVMQKDGLTEKLSCIDNMRYACALQGMKSAEAKTRIRECAELCGLEPFLRKRVALCSGGMRQKLNIAVALLAKPRLLLLDEASAGLDARSRNELNAILMDFVYKERGALIIITHYREETAGLCSRSLDMEIGAEC
jgi:ABC-2 type transport system ATP-binding protein